MCDRMADRMTDRLADEPSTVSLQRMRNSDTVLGFSAKKKLKSLYCAYLPHNLLVVEISWVINFPPLDKWRRISRIFIIS